MNPIPSSAASGVLYGEKNLTSIASSPSLRHSPYSPFPSSPLLFPQSLLSHHNPVEPAMHRLNSPFIQHVSYWRDRAKKNLQMPAPSVTSRMASNLPWLRSILNDPFRQKKKWNNVAKKVGETHAGVWMGVLCKCKMFPIWRDDDCIWALSSHSKECGWICRAAASTMLS